MARIELLAPVGAVAGNAVPLAKRRSHARGSSRRSPQQFEVRYPPVPGSRRGAAPERAQRVQDHPLRQEDCRASCARRDARGGGSRVRGGDQRDRRLRILHVVQCPRQRRVPEARHSDRDDRHWRVPDPVRERRRAFSLRVWAQRGSSPSSSLRSPNIGTRTSARSSLSGTMSSAAPRSARMSTLTTYLWGSRFASESRTRRDLGGDLEGAHIWMTCTCGDAAHDPPVAVRVEGGCASFSRVLGRDAQWDLRHPSFLRC